MPKEGWITNLTGRQCLIQRLLEMRMSLVDKACRVSRGRSESTTLARFTSPSSCSDRMMEIILSDSRSRQSDGYDCRFEETRNPDCIGEGTACWQGCNIPVVVLERSGRTRLHFQTKSFYTCVYFSNWSIVYLPFFFINSIYNVAMFLQQSPLSCFNRLILYL